jgi:adenosylmethionine-8-amino-7-oxononanoate aminotransferase
MVLRQLEPTPAGSGAEDKRTTKKSAVLHRDLGYDFLPLTEGRGSHLLLGDGRKIFDASGGAAVGCIGWGNERVARAVTRQILAIPYCSTVFYTTKVQEELCRYLVDSTNGHMGRAYIINSGQCAVSRGLSLPQLTRTRLRSDGGSRQACAPVLPRA